MAQLNYNLVSTYGGVYRLNSGVNFIEPRRNFCDILCFHEDIDPIHAVVVISSFSAPYIFNLSRSGVYVNGNFVRFFARINPVDVVSFPVNTGSSPRLMLTTHAPIYDIE